MQQRLGNGDKDWDGAVNLKERVQFDAAFGPAKLGPGKERQTKTLPTRGAFTFPGIGVIFSQLLTAMFLAGGHHEPRRPIHSALDRQRRHGGA